jgi:hypothetical protein
VRDIERIHGTPVTDSLRIVHWIRETDRKEPDCIITIEDLIEQTIFDGPRLRNAAKRGTAQARAAFSGSAKGARGRIESMAAFASKASRSNCNVIPPERLAHAWEQHKQFVIA